MPGLEEEAHLRLAEAIDRLHRVAHQEQRAAIALFPPGGELLQQLELRVRRVLEFVDEHVADAVVEHEKQVRGAVVAFERAQRALRDLDEVRLAAQRENHLQLGHRERRKIDDRLEHLPLGLRIARGRKLLHGAQRDAQRLVPAQSLGRWLLAPLAFLRKVIGRVTDPRVDVAGARRGQSGGPQPARFGERRLPQLVEQHLRVQLAVSMADASPAGQCDRRARLCGWR